MSETEASKEQIAKILRMIENAESSLKAAQEMLTALDPDAANFSLSSNVDTKDATAYEEGESQIVEGYFDGQNMIGPNEKIYPIPANYASKSKLVAGDKLKLTILPNGSFLYKQIAPIDRIFVKGTLINEDGQYKVIADGESYRVLLASVTYYKGTVGDEVTLILPKDSNATWGAIEAIIPQVSVGNYNAAESL
jgi:hypothetical protein